MQLTKHTDYAYRVLIYLAGMDDDKATIQEITDAFGISKAHLMKVANKLANKGWVESIRGKNGGISLGVPVEDIALHEVFILMERTIDPVNCSAPACYINGVCELKPILMGAQQAYIGYLAQFTLADLIDKKTVQLLNAHDVF